MVQHIEATSLGRSGVGLKYLVRNDEVAARQLNLTPTSPAIEGHQQHRAVVFAISLDDSFVEQPVGSGF